MKNQNSGFSLVEVLITMILVGILSVLSGAMLIFAYSMFEKVMGNGTSSIEYKTFRLRTEKIFRNMTKQGPVLGDMILVDDKGNESKRIKFDVEYLDYPYNKKTYKRKYNAPEASSTTTKYYDSGVVDPGTWAGHVGRSVSLYSCVENEKIDANYRRYLMTMEVDSKTSKRIVVLYEWNLPANDKFLDISDETHQNSKFPKASALKREVVLSDVADFQVTTRLSNLLTNRIKDSNKYAKVASVRLYVQLGEDSDAQYSNDMIFANKSVYGDVDSFFVDIKATNVRP